MTATEETSTCPTVGLPTEGLGIDPRLALLLREAPITRVAMPYGADSWLVSRHADVCAVTNDVRFSRAPLGRTVDAPRITPTFVAPPDAVQRKDLPRSAMMREATGKGINPRRMRGYQAVVDELVDEFVEAVVRHGQPADLVDIMTSRLPLAVMGHLMAIPREMQENIRTWTLGLFSVLEERHEETEAAKHGLFGYLGSLLQERRANPGADLASKLVTDTDAGLTDGELITVMGQMLAIGIAPTDALLGDILYALLTRPGETEKVLADPGYLGPFIEEICRYTQVLTGFGPALIAKEDIEFGGVTIAEGDSVVYSYVSANRDPSTFPEPDTFDVSRANSKHLMFGAGQHACVGPHFSRMVWSTAVTTLLARLPGLALAIPESEVVWNQKTVWRHPETLPVIW